MLEINETNNTIKLTRGDTARFTVEVIDHFDNSDYEIAEDDILSFTVKQSYSSAHVYIKKEVVGSGEFHIEPADTKKMQFGAYVYDVQLKTAAGDVYTIISPSIFEIMPEVNCL